ncbi:MAG: PEP/pyruvate-binding domain-containing protein, partial [Ideonella sp.]|nr:PEP/pyruvate-binding domain-containing protein [Ideonella sp.]
MVEGGQGGQRLWWDRARWVACGFVLWLASGGPATAQLGQKPSGYQADRSAAPAAPPPSAQGLVAQPGRPAPGSTADALPGWLFRLKDRTEFDLLARVYDAGTPLALPHLIFAIDRGQADKVYFIHSRRFQFHEQFLKARDHVSDFGPGGLNENYRSPQRRYLFGTLAWRAQAKAWAYEFWEGDRLTPELLALAQQRLGEQFFAPVVFKPNSAAQEAVGQGLKLSLLTQADVIAQQGFLPLNTGRAVGRLRVLSPGQSVDSLEPDDIALLQEVPLSLPPVAGVLTTRPSTTLSHVNLLAKGWGIPNAYVREVKDWLTLDGQWVALSVQRTGVSLTPSRAEARTTAHRPGAPKAWPQPDLKRAALLPLGQMRAVDRRRCGSKAANLGELTHAQQQGALKEVAPVPDGFCIPFADFAAFMAQAQAQQALRAAQAAPGFAESRAVRVRALAQLRETLVALPLPEGQATRWQAAWQRQLAGDGVFVRSSSNSEDLPGFSGAGLYTTVPNVKRADALEQAVKTVWASVFNAEAWEARRWHGVPHDKVVMGVLVQRAIDARSSGVLVTLNPFDTAQSAVTYVSAKRGLGIRVVEGQRQAEQVLYARRSNAIQVLSRSDDPTALLLDEQGGVREHAVEPGWVVLSDDLVRQLAHMGEQVRSLLG